MQMNSLDIFCEVIDNYGDIGVVYRLAKEFKKIYNRLKVRVFLNRIEEFTKINDKALALPYQKIDDIEYITFDYLVKNICTFSTANVIIEAFGCNIPEEYLEKAKNNSELLINLEYLSGEDWVDTAHLLSSPLGDCRLKKYFFMPGFSKKSGGVIIDSLYLERQKEAREKKFEILKRYIPDFENRKNIKVGTLFSYKRGFEPLFQELEKREEQHYLLILGEKSRESVENLLKNKQYKNVKPIFLPFLRQEEYEELINVVDYNFVRGEDSFVRALLTGKPFLWNIYIQDEMAHLDKLEGFIKHYKESVYEIDNKAFEIHTKLLRDYNSKQYEDFEIGDENYKDFFENFVAIESISLKFSEYLKKNCNLIDKLNSFILNF